MTYDIIIYSLFVSSVNDSSKSYCNANCTKHTGKVILFFMVFIGERLYWNSEPIMSTM